MQTMMSSDVENPASACLIAQRRIDTSRVNPKRGSAYIEFVWEIYSASVFNLEFTDRVDGELRYTLKEPHEQLGLIRQPPQLRVPPILKHLKRISNGELILRQYLPTEVWNDIQSRTDLAIVFDFSLIKFVVNAKSVDGQSQHEWKLSPPPEWELQIEPERFFSQS